MARDGYAVVSRNARWAKKRYAEDPEYRRKTLAAHRAWRAANRDAINARRRQKWRNDPELRAKSAAALELFYARRRRRAAEDPEFRAAVRASERRREIKHCYGFAAADYDAALLRQGGLCAICRKPYAKTLCIDHCHATGKFRGLLCRKCNFVLGLCGDDPDVAEAAAAYLRTHSS